MRGRGVLRYPCLYGPPVSQSVSSCKTWKMRRIENLGSLSFSHNFFQRIWSYPFPSLPGGFVPMPFQNNLKQTRIE